MQAMDNFFYVPRYRGATLVQPIKYKYGGVLVRPPVGSRGAPICSREAPTCSREAYLQKRGAYSQQRGAARRCKRALGVS
jgi:hypothetical protein